MLKYSQWSSINELWLCSYWSLFYLKPRSIPWPMFKGKEVSVLSWSITDILVSSSVQLKPSFEKRGERKWPHTICSSCSLKDRFLLSSSFQFAFLMLWPFTILPYDVLIPKHKIILLLLHNCNFATVMNCNINLCIFSWSQLTLVNGLFTPKGTLTYRLRTIDLVGYKQF